jgi:hypothetical protein
MEEASLMLVLVRSIYPGTPLKEKLKESFEF